jgi:PHD/YefM family antitoxin component YafN of YafNO toxin-antitoxin module
MRALKEIPCQYVTDDDGKKTAVIIPIDTYEAILEDILDLAAVAEKREESTVSHSDVIAQLKADGLLPN